MCHSLGTQVGHLGLESPAMALQTLPGKSVHCYSNKEKKVNEKTAWKRESTVNASAVMLHLSCKEEIKFCLPLEMSPGKMIPSFIKWHHIVSSFQFAVVIYFS